MSKANVRLKVLKASRRTRHRYDLLRVLSQTVSLGILVLVPLSGLARVDLWAGGHALLFRPATLKHGLAGVVLAIGALYVVTFLSNVVAGRVFCGWGCPVGQVSRLGEILDTPRLKGRARWLAQLYGAAFSFVTVIAFFAWWVDLRVFWLGSPRALSVAWGTLVVCTGLAFAHGRWWQWHFCKSACPIGLYYSFVSPANWYGVYFRNQESSCIECNACDNVCPVDLAPRDLMTPIEARAGISIADAPGRNHCLECGDCIRACEWMIEMKGDGPVPLLLGYHSGPQRVDRSSSPAPEEQASAH
jgi:ferredoxin-type protein NapH